VDVADRTKIHEWVQPDTTCATSADVVITTQNAACLLCMIMLMLWIGPENWDWVQTDMMSTTSADAVIITANVAFLTIVASVDMLRVVQHVTKLS